MSNQDQNGPKTGATAQNRAGGTASLPVITGHARPRPALARHKIPAYFLTQLIAERECLAIQRSRRRVPSIFASNTYEATAKRSIRHMPAGYGLAQSA